MGCRAGVFAEKREIGRRTICFEIIKNPPAGIFNSRKIASPCQESS